MNLKSLPFLLSFCLLAPAIASAEDDDARPIMADDEDAPAKASTPRHVITRNEHDAAVKVEQAREKADVQAQAKAKAKADAVAKAEADAEAHPNVEARAKAEPQAKTQLASARRPQAGSTSRHAKRKGKGKGKARDQDEARQASVVEPLHEQPAPEAAAAAPTSRRPLVAKAGAPAAEP